ncbi:unnamed protein product, partial [Polarella glacialis]
GLALERTRSGESRGGQDESMRKSASMPSASASDSRAAAEVIVELRAALRSSPGGFAAGEAPSEGNAARHSRPASAATAAGRLRRGIARPRSAANLTEVATRVRVAGALRPAAARRLSEVNLSLADG